MTLPDMAAAAAMALAPLVVAVLEDLVGVMV